MQAGLHRQLAGARQAVAGVRRAAIAKQIWLYSWVDAGMSLSCWMWNRTPVGQV